MYNIPLLEEMHLRLEDEYFDSLEQHGIEYLEHDRVSDDPELIESTVKLQFRLSDDVMAQELCYDDFSNYVQEKLKEDGILQPNWIARWTQQLLEERGNKIRESLKNTGRYEDSIVLIH